jgi:CBS domain containing-hemolysin-like protein
MLGVEPKEELRSARQPTELRSLVLRSAAQGAIDDETAELVARSIAFGDRTAADVRTPRVRVTFLEAKDTAADVIEAARATGHSRFPVIDKSPDDVVGVVHIKQAVAVEPERRRNVRLSEIADPATTVPDSIELDPLLTLLRDQGMQMAVVVDEYGGTDGVVTLEDLVEEIVGDIADEHDRLSARSRHRSDGTWSLSGLLRPDEVAEQTGLLLPESEDYETIGGLMHAVLGRIAERDDTVDLEAVPTSENGDDAMIPAVPVRLTVEHMQGRRIDRIVLTRMPDASASDEADS